MKTPLPTVHTNGTSRTDLIKGYEDAYYAIDKAMSALQAIEFNARDYYTQGTDAWPRARNARALHLDYLSRVKEHISEHLEHLSTVS